MVELTKKRMVDHTFLCKFYHIRTAVKRSILNQLTPNVGILQSSVCSLFLGESCDVIIKI